jgi:hypothetical protein
MTIDETLNILMYINQIYREILYIIIQDHIHVAFTFLQ